MHVESKKKVLTAILVLTAACIAACTKPAANAAVAPAAPSVPPVNITVVSARAMELQRSVKITGSLVGLETATLSNRVTGRVTKIYFDRGGRVKPGEVMLEIEPDRFQMAVDESKGTLEQTLARLGLKEIPKDDFDISQTAPVKKAQSEYDNAKAKLDRATPLNQSKALNDFEYLDIVNTFRSAASALETSRYEARALLAEARQNNATMDMKAKDFTDSKILAPDGTTPEGWKIDSYAVSDRKVSPGEYIREGTSLFTLVADGTLKLQSHVPERYLGDVKKDAIVTFHVEAYPNENFEGKVATIDPTVDPASRTFLIEALVDNVKYKSRLRPGSFVPGEVLTKKDAGRIMVPQTAISTFVGVSKIYKIDAQSNPPKVKAITVSTGQDMMVTDDAGQQDHWVEVLSGDVTAGDQIATSGQTKLVDGSVVTIRKSETAEKPAASASTSIQP